MKVYGLYGKSGTGKSHVAQHMAYKLGVQSIIDDGILIVNQMHVAGVSAKCERYLHSATKRAVFYWDIPRNEVAIYIREAKINELLILGTSQKMIRCILDRLELSPSIEWISIETIQTKNEVDIAINKRRAGFHAIPIKPLHVSKAYNGWFKKETLIYDNISLEITIIKPFI